MTAFALGALRIISFYSPGWKIEAFAGPAPVTLVGRIVSEPKIDLHKATFLLSDESIDTRNGQYLIHGTTAVLVHGAALESAAQLRYGDRIESSGLLQKIFPATNPGEFDWRTYLIHRGVSGELVVQRPDGVSIIRSPGLYTKYEIWSEVAETRFKILFAGFMPPNESGLLTAVLFGDRQGISPELSRDFAATGTSHIIATAGLHVGIMALVLSAALYSLPISRKQASFLLIVILWGFAALAGLRPPVVRAVLTATIFFSGRIFERASDNPTSLAAAAIGILAFEPTALFESDFQLSFVTVAGILLLIPHWESYWKPKLEALQPGALRKAAGYIVELVGLSAIAQLSAALLVVYYFNQLSVLALPVNLIVVPLLFILIPAAVLTLILSIALPPSAMFCSKFLLHPLLWVILHVVRYFAGLPFCSIVSASPPPLIIVLLYTWAFGILLIYRLTKPVTVTSEESAA